jgi:hypothetical protein
MIMNIRPYNESNDFENLILLFKSEKDWSCYLEEDTIEKYKTALSKSITYVAYSEQELIGYSRSIDDFGKYIYICDLLVNKKFRGRHCGRLFMEQLCDDYPDQEIFVMSDVDQY